MAKLPTLFPWSVAVCALFSGVAIGAEPPALYEQRVRPILEQNCYACHSHSAKKVKGGLMLDSPDAIRKGGDNGPAIVPAKPDESLLLTAVGYADESLRMPPKKKLPDDQIAVLRAWVAAGAKTPAASGKMASRPRGKITAEDRQWWSFQPLHNPAPPPAADPEWRHNPIDQFVRQRLDAEGLKPSPPASRAVLIRRVYFDLIGLPPTPDEVSAFVADAAPDAYERLIDRLLASPRYGERWARHWLDLVRYAESDGFKLDEYRPDAWRYRDYVVQSFNDDTPYDRFVREQLAGDELAPNDPNVLAATGFLRLGIYEYNNRDAKGQWGNMLNDVTDVVGDAFLGLGMGCARCHDHKFDPILQKDYFRLQAFFAPVQPHDDVPLATPQQQAEYREKLAIWEAKTAEVRAKIEALEAPVRAKAEKDAVAKFPNDIKAILHKPEAERTPYEQQIGALAYRQVLYDFAHIDAKFKDEKKQTLIQLRKELTRFDADKPAPLAVGPTTFDVGPDAPPTFIPKKTGEPIAPGFPTVLDETDAEVRPVADRPTTGRRTALADWLTRPDNPLTARVMVNRVWQHHFGRGLVATTSDFGRLGEPASHPELLDYLARRFVADGWSFKRLHRLILTSAAYRQSATAPADETALRKDPENRLLGRAVTRRLDAEQIRDAMLAMTGRLDPTAGGPSVDPTKPRRTIYCKVRRNYRDPLLDVFDAPEGFNSTAERNVTTTPTQALLLINSPFMLDQAQSFADRLRRDHPSDDDARLDAAFRLAFGRPATTGELARSRAFLSRQAERVPATVEPGADLPSGKFPYREGHAVLVQPGTMAARLCVPESPNLPSEDFTLEAFVMLNTLYDDGTVRPIAAHWTGDPKSPGWAFGVTSKKSAYKPQSLVLQLWGSNADGAPETEAVFSGLHLDLGKPYFVAVSAKPGDVGQGGIAFYAKDLSNDDEPLQTARMAHKLARVKAVGPFDIGHSTARQQERTWDGLIDDVRLSRVALPEEKLLLTSDGVTDQTAGYWKFETNPGPMRDSSPNGLHLTAALPRAARAKGTSGVPAALADFCHVLLNANEFLYVD